MRTQINMTIRIATGMLLLSVPAVVWSAQYDDCIVTEHGNPLKIILCEEAALYEAPDLSSKKNSANRFEFYYVLKPEQDSPAKFKNGFYHVGTGPNAAEECGWIPLESAIEWPTGLALQLRPSGGRQLARFYATKDDLTAARGGSQNAKPVAIEADTGVAHRCQGLLPVLASSSTSVNGFPVAVYRVVILRHSGPSSARQENVFDWTKTSLDVVFVLDTTKGMDRFIDATRTVTDRIISRLPPLQNTLVGKEVSPSSLPRVRFGLVAYRDVMETTPPDWYVTKLVCDLEQGADHAQFQRRIATVRAAIQADGDTPEDVLAGLKLAIEASKWNPNGFKELILIGDASAHTELNGSKNSQKQSISSIQMLLQPPGPTVLEKKVLHTVRVIGKNNADYERCAYQFRQLAAAVEYQGSYWEFADSEYGTKEFVDEIASAVLKDYGGLCRAADGRLPPRETLTLGILAKTPAGDASQRETNKPEFITGYTSDIDGSGNEMYFACRLVRRDRLQLFHAFLRFTTEMLRSAGPPGARNVTRILDQINAACVGLNLDEALTPNCPLSRIVNVICDFPIDNENCRATLQEMAEWDQLKFERWVAFAAVAQRKVDNILADDAIWFNVGKETRLHKRHAFVRVTDLP